MAGLYGLFGGRKGQDQGQPQNKEAFFLDNDTAKTLGDTKFMRTPITIKRTFANGGELVQEISSLEKKKAGKSNIPPKQIQSPTSSQSTTPASTERRKTDTSMDMFRDMARNIKR